MPIVCLIDTPGAYPGVGAEERGQALAIAENIRDMFSIKSPIVIAVIGEGGSGGALGIGVGDKVLIMSFCGLSDREAKRHKPKIVYVDAHNRQIRK